MRGGGLDGYFGVHGLRLGIQVSYGNSIRVKFGGGVSEDGLEGNFWEEGLPPVAT